MVAFSKSTGISLLVHAIAVFGLYAWPTPSSDPVTFSGQRDVISLEACLSSATSSFTVELESPSEEEPLVPPHEPVSAAVVERQVEFAVETRRHPVAAPLPVKLEAPTVPRKPAMDLRLADSRRSINDIELPDPKNDSADPIRRRRRSATPATSLPASLPKDQLVGLRDNAAVDFSGNPPPVYPGEAVRKRLQGTVLLRLYVDVRGNIDKLEIAKSSGHAILDDAAATAVAKWKGQPAQSASGAVASVEVLPIRFRL